MATEADREAEEFLSQLRRVNSERYDAWATHPLMLCEHCGASSNTDVPECAPPFDRKPHSFNRPHPYLTVSNDAGIMFDALELGGEVGELLNVVKKLEREARGWCGSRASDADFADECADVLICLDKLARRRGVDLTAATVAKFNATSDKVGLPHKLACHRTASTAALTAEVASLKAELEMCTQSALRYMDLYGQATVELARVEPLEAEIQRLREAFGWRDIGSAPKDGTTIDVWRDGTRATVYRGVPPHTCGEMGEYCDSDWHSLKKPGWICSTFGEYVGGKHDPFTHWKPLDAGPAAVSTTSEVSEPVAEMAALEALEGPTADGNVSLHEAWRDLHNAMLHDQRTVGFRLDLWNRLEDIMRRPSGEPVADESGGEGEKIENRPRLLAMDFANSIEEPIRGIDERGHPYLSYSAAHVQEAYVAGMAKARDLATPQPVSGDAVREALGWQPIETCPMWQVAIVTDGESVAKAQKAEADYGGFYWSVEPEDALEWEPTHWIGEPAALNHGGTQG